MKFAFVNDRGQTSAVNYDAFISYSHSADQALAADLQRGLETLVKPWYRRRPFLRIYRDETSFGAAADLGERIRGALDQANHLVYLLSRDSAESTYVNDEITYWLDRKEHPKDVDPKDLITIVVTEWDGPDGKRPKSVGAAAAYADLGDFDWAGPDLPERLRGVYEEPLVVDLRWARPLAGTLTIANEDFEGRVAEVAAPIKKTTKDELIGTVVGMRTRARMLTGSIALGAAVLLLALLAAGLGWLAARDAEQAARGRQADAEIAAAESERSAAAAADAEREAIAARTAAQEDAAEALRLQTEAEDKQTEAERLARDADIGRRLAEAAERRAATAAGLAEERQRLAEEAQRDAERSRVAAEELQRLAEESAAAAEEDAEVAREQRAIAVQDRDAAQQIETATALAVASTSALAEGDATLALALAAESALATPEPLPAAYSALAASRRGFSSDRLHRLGDRIEVGDAGGELPLVVSPDGRRIIQQTGSIAGGIIERTLTDGVPDVVASERWLYEPTECQVPPCDVVSLAVSPNGARVVTAVSVGLEFPRRTVVRLLDDAWVGNRASIELEGGAPSVRVSDAGLVAIDVSEPDSIVLWDARSSAIADIPLPDDDATYSLEGVTDDGSVLVFRFPPFLSDDPQSLLICSTSACEPARFTPSECTFESESSCANAIVDERLAIVPDGVYLDPLGAPRFVAQRPERDGAIFTSFARDGRRDVLYRASTDGHLYVSSMSTGLVVGEPIRVSDHALGAVSWIESLDELVVADLEGGIIRLDLEPAPPSHLLETFSGRGSIAVSHDASTFATLDYRSSGMIDVRDAEMRVRWTAPVAVDGSNEAVWAVTVNDRHLLVAVEQFSTPNGYFLFDHRAGRGVVPLAAVLDWEARAVLATGADVLVAQPADGSVLAITEPGDIAAESVVELRPPGSSFALGFGVSPSGSHVALVEQSTEFVLLDARSGRELARTSFDPGFVNATRRDSVTDVDVDPTNGVVVVSFGHDRTAFLWDVSSGREPLRLVHTRTFGNGSIDDAATMFVVDGGRAAWDIASGRPVETGVVLPADEVPIVGNLGAMSSVEYTSGLQFVTASEVLQSFDGPADSYSSRLRRWNVFDAAAACRLSIPRLIGRDLQSIAGLDRTPRCYEIAPPSYPTG